MNRPLFVFIHGFRGTHHGMALITKALSEPRVLVPDLPGFGNGPHLDSYSLHDYVEWLHSYLQQQAPDEPIVLVGHSFGSIISSSYASRYPDTLRQLILINPIGAPALKGPRAILSNLALVYYKMGEKLPARLAHHWLSSGLFVRLMSEIITTAKDAKTRRYIHDQHRQYFSRFHSPSSLSQAFDVSISHNVRDFAQDIPVPTLLIAGEIDDITTVGKQRQLLALFPTAQLEIIPKVGHLTHYEAPQQVATLIQAFTKRS